MVWCVVQLGCVLYISGLVYSDPKGCVCGVITETLVGGDPMFEHTLVGRWLNDRTSPSSLRVGVNSSIFCPCAANCFVFAA